MTWLKQMWPRIGGRDWRSCFCKSSSGSASSTSLMRSTEMMTSCNWFQRTISRWKGLITLPNSILKATNCPIVSWFWMTCHAPNHSSAALAVASMVALKIWRLLAITCPEKLVLMNLLKSPSQCQRTVCSSAIDLTVRTPVSAWIR